jgi:hypothetical protein
MPGGGHAEPLDGGALLLKFRPSSVFSSSHAIVAVGMMSRPGSSSSVKAMPAW